MIILACSNSDEQNGALDEEQNSSAGGNDSAFESSENPQFVEATAEEQLAQGMERNYNHVDAEGKEGGTGIEDIVTWARRSGCFKSGVVSFAGLKSASEKGLKKPDRFSDNAKFNHALDLLDVATDDDHRAILLQTELDNTSLEDVANAIADAALTKLDRWENKTKKGRSTTGYSGVGSRVQKLKSKHKTFPPPDNQRNITDYPQQSRPEYHRIGSGNKQSD